jgi:DnaJ like chaperone protein
MAAAVLGKLLGGTLGYLVGGLYGALGGAVLGHAIDAGWLHWRPQEGLRASRGLQAQVEFLFLCLGHLAKADGRVSDSEVAAAQRYMDRLGLDAEGRRAAIAAFERGRAGGFDLIAEATRFRRQLRLQFSDIEELMRALIDFARKDGSLSPAERGVIERLGAGLACPPERVAQWLADRGHPAEGPALAECYRLLGISAGVSDEELTRAWRRALAQHHPDKLQGRGAGREEIEQAATKTRELQAAYQRIMAARGRGPT